MEHVTFTCSASCAAAPTTGAAIGNVSDMSTFVSHTVAETGVTAMVAHVGRRRAGQKTKPHRRGGAPTVVTLHDGTDGTRLGKARSVHGRVRTNLPCLPHAETLSLHDAPLAHVAALSLTAQQPTRTVLVKAASHGHKHSRCTPRHVFAGSSSPLCCARCVGT